MIIGRFVGYILLVKWNVVLVYFFYLLILVAGGKKFFKNLKNISREFIPVYQMASLFRWEVIPSDAIPLHSGSFWNIYLEIFTPKAGDKIKFSTNKKINLIHSNYWMFYFVSRSDGRTEWRNKKGRTVNPS